MITVGDEQLKELFVGEMGIKNACIGEEPIYTFESSVISKRS